jgi:hypothetical protein
MYVYAILDIGTTSGNRVLTLRAPWEGRYFHFPLNHCACCANARWEVAVTRCHADDEIKAVGALKIRITFDGFFLQKATGVQLNSEVCTSSQLRRVQKICCHRLPPHYSGRALLRLSFGV